MIVDKVKKPEDIKKLKKLPEQFIEEMAKKVPEHFLKIFRDCVELLLKRINVPENEIEQITEKIHERRFNDMFEFIDGYDVQATRRQAKEEGKLEARKEFENEIKTKDEEIKRLKEELEKSKKSNKRE